MAGDIETVDFPPIRVKLEYRNEHGGDWDLRSLHSLSAGEEIFEDTHPTMIMEAAKKIGWTQNTDEPFDYQVSGALDYICDAAKFRVGPGRHTIPGPRPVLLISLSLVDDKFVAEISRQLGAKITVNFTPEDVEFLARWIDARAKYQKETP